MPRGVAEKLRGRAAERRTIAALSATGEAPARSRPPRRAGGEAERSRTRRYAASRATPRSSRSPPASRGSRGWCAKSSPRATSARAARPRPSRSPSSCRTWWQQPVRATPRCRPRSCPCSPTCCSRAARRGVAAGLDAVLDHADRARRDHGLLHPRRRDDHAAVHRADVQRRAERPDGRALAGAVPGRAAARPDRPARRDPAVLRPLHDPRDLPGGVEPRDHRRCWSCSRRTSTATTRSTPTRSASWPRPACSWRWRSARSGGSTSACSSASTGTTRASGRCSC